MAGTFMKLFIVILMLNTFLYIGINYTMKSGTDVWTVSGSIFDKLYDGDVNSAIISEREGLNVSNDFNITKTLTIAPNQKSGEAIGDGGISLLDALKIFWSIIPTLWGIALVPISIITWEGMPLMLKLVIAFPLSLLELVALFLLIRGAD